MPGHGGQDGDGTGPDGQNGDNPRSGDADEPGWPGPAAAPARPDQGQDRPGPAGPPGRPAPPAGLAGTVNFTIPLTTWLGLTGGPGEAAGYGYLDAAASRDLATAITASPGSRWCLTITSPGGHAIGHACARKEQPPPGPAPPGDPVPASGPAPPGSASPGTGPPSPHSGPAPPGTGSPRPPGRQPAPPGTGNVRWLTGLTISWLETGTCGHARETSAYQPSPALRHLLQTRDRTCSYPGCRRPATRCDDDHTTPYDQGGRTCECNLAALCRRHHQAKQAPGWHLEQPRPGTLTWTLPSSRTYTTTPAPLPGLAITQRPACAASSGTAGPE